MTARASSAAASRQGRPRPAAARRSWPGCPRREPALAQGGGQPVPLGDDGGAAGPHLVLAGQRRDGGGLGEHGDAERHVGLAHRLGHGRVLGDQVADPQPRQAPRLGERAQDGDVRPAPHELQAVGDVGVGDELAVGLVEDDERSPPGTASRKRSSSARRTAVPVGLFGLQTKTRRVVSSIAASSPSRSWVSAGPPGPARDERHLDGPRAGDVGEQRVHLERAPGEGEAGVRVVEGLGQLLAERDRAAAGGHLRGVDAVPVGQRAGEDDGAVVGVAVGLAGGLGQRTDDGRQRRERDLVAGQLDRAVDADLAGEVGGVAARACRPAAPAPRRERVTTTAPDLAACAGSPRCAEPRVGACAYSSPVEPATSAA